MLQIFPFSYANLDAPITSTVLPNPIAIAVTILPLPKPYQYQT